MSEQERMSEVEVLARLADERNREIRRLGATVERVKALAARCYCQRSYVHVNEILSALDPPKATTFTHGQTTFTIGPDDPPGETAHQRHEAVPDGYGTMLGSGQLTAHDPPKATGGETL